MQKKESNLINLIKATRIKRTLTILTIILIPAAYKNTLPIEILTLATIIILIYSASSIYNAYKDNDYKLPKYSKKIILTLTLTALILALTNKTIFTISIIAIILSYIYNTSARFIILGDTFIAGLTHFVLPLLTSSIIVEMQITKVIPLSIALYSTAICIGPVTNLKDIEEDKKRNYKTLVNSIKNPFSTTGLIFEITFISIALIYLFLEINNPIFLLIPIFILKILVTNKIYNKKPRQALNLLRLYLISAFLILIFNLTTNIKIISAGTTILIIYILTLILNKNGKI